MSFLSSAVTKRRLALLCARLLVQYVMACSIEQVGTDEIEAKGIRVADAASTQPTARNERSAGPVKADGPPIGLSPRPKCNHS
jgi:hypothetical protein